MSVLESNVIDAIAKSNDKKEFIMLISDHLDWEDEYNHLLILQKKINAYIGYVETE